MMKNKEYTLKPFDLEKYAKYLNEFVSMDVAYFQGDPHVDAMIECIVTAKKYEKRIRELETEVGELRTELKEAEEEYDRVYEQAEAVIRANMADGGTSCHWCIDGHRREVVQKMQIMIKEECIAGGIYPAFVARVVENVGKKLLEDENNG